jgi:hypothetical protein
MLQQFFVIVLSTQIIGCYHEWDLPKAPLKRKKQEQCIKIVNGTYLYVEDCKFWGFVPSSDGHAILPP